MAFQARADGPQFFGEEREGEAKYEVSHVIGKGSYGTVCAARNRHTGEKVAIKHIDRVFADKADTVRIIRELRFLRVLKHPNIIGVVDVLLPTQRKAFDDIYIVFELLDTDLAHMIRSKTKYDETHRQWLTYQLLAGLKHVHAANVFHRDLKPANVLLNADCDLKICDFGLARANFPTESEQKHAMFWTDYVATRWYRAPELICSYYTKYTTAIDVWSVGCIFAEMMRRKPLFPGHNVYHQLDLITDLLGTPTEEEIAKVRSQKARDYLNSLPFKPRRELRPLFPGCDPLAVDMVSLMLTFDPDKRISCSDALMHPYFGKFRGMTLHQDDGTAPHLMQREFEWENEKSLTVEKLREILYREIEMYHPEMAGASFAPMAGMDVRDQMTALERGDAPSSSSMSMPPSKTQPLYETAARMAAAGDLADMPSPRAMMAADGTDTLNEGGGMHDMIPVDDDDMVLEDSEKSQTISADTIKKLMETHDTGM